MASRKPRPAWDRARRDGAVAGAVLVAALLASGAPAAARPLTADRFVQASDDPAAWLVDGRYIRDPARIARMRRMGELPDRVRAGRCTYELAGDPGVVYYARTCR